MERQMDTGDCIISHANAVSENHKQNYIIVKTAGTVVMSTIC